MSHNYDLITVTISHNYKFILLSFWLSTLQLNLQIKSNQIKSNQIKSNQIKSNQIKSNQITFIVTSPQHKCLGEWNSYERAPEQQTIYIWTDSAKKTALEHLQCSRQCKKQQQQFTYGQTVQKNNKQFTYGQTVQKTTNNYIWTDSAKNNNNLHMDRQCKKNCTGAFTVLQTVQKNKQTKKQLQQFTYGQYIFTDCTEDNVQNTHTQYT